MEIAHPVGCVYRAAVEQHQWPDLWKIEKQVMLKKCPSPQTKDDMRNLGLSLYFNKGLEQLLASRLLLYVSRFLTRDQFGGHKGWSLNHYLARLVDFIYMELDNGQLSPPWLLISVKRSINWIMESS